MTIIIGICITPLVCCCPCDERELYVAPDGSQWTHNGAKFY